MKKLVVSVFCVVALVSSSAAMADYYYYHGHYGHYGHYHGGGHYAASCSAAPENVAKVEAQMDQLLATPEFANATALKAKIAAIRENQDPAARADAYMSLAGIDSPQQFAELVGNESLRQKYVLTMSANYGLSAAQANALINAIETGLLGDLK